MKTRIILCFTMLFLMSIYSFAQDKAYNYNERIFDPYLNRMSYSIGVGFGVYNGELSNFFDPALQKYYLNPGGGVGFSYRFFERVSLRGEVNVFKLYSESIGKYEGQSRVFNSINVDYYVNAVIDLFPQRKIDGRFQKWNPYIFGGVGQVIFFPDDNKSGSTNTGEIISDTTAYPVNFSRTSVIYPVGVGVKYFIDKNHYISFEGNYRFTRTDFLDALQDLSHPPLDKYVTIFFKYTVIIDPLPRKSFSYQKYTKTRRRLKNKN